MIPDFNKGNGLVPAIIQDYKTLRVLMLGYMSKEAFAKTTQEKRVTFFSRSKNRLWTKGETSGNFLEVKSITLDCDSDSLLIRVNPIGPVCHNGTVSCFDSHNSSGFIYELEKIIQERHQNPSENSYTSQLFTKGMNKIAQKVGEEAVELVIEAKDSNNELFLNEAADLLYHYLILLRAKGFEMSEVESILAKRNSK